jgi:hypothetical protein
MLVKQRTLEEHPYACHKSRWETADEIRHKMQFNTVLYKNTKEGPNFFPAI